MNICHKLYIFVLYYEEKLFCDFVYLWHLLLGLQLPMQYSNLKEICVFFVLTGLLIRKRCL